MKTILVSFLFLSIILTAKTFAQATSVNDPDKLKLDAITLRIRKGDEATISEIADIKPELSVPAIARTAQSKADPERMELARATLSRIKGVEDYLKGKIDALVGKQGVDAIDERCDQMKILALVRTNKAIRIIASYLFDDKSPGFSGGDYSIVSNKVHAAILLDYMDFPNPPRGAEFYKTDDEYVEAWRAWWLKHKDEFADSKPYKGAK